jgi:hypothetical protein
MPGNNLPVNPGWTWGNGPRNPSRTASTGGWRMEMNSLEDNKAFADQANAIAAAPKEISNWVKLYTNDLPIWNAYNSLNTNKETFYSSISLVNSFENSISKSMGGDYNFSVKGNLINFVLDGTLPTLDLRDLRSSIESNLTVMWYGIQVLNKSGVEVQQSTINTYQTLLSLYCEMNPTYNFNLNLINNK